MRFNDYKYLNSNSDESIIVTIVSLIIVPILIVAIVIIGGSEADNSDKTETMKIIESSFDYQIYVDIETNVMYLDCYKDGLTVIVNPDGTPKLWEGEE